MIGSWIGAGLKAGASIFGGLKASRAMNRVKKNLAQQRADNTAWYDRRYNEDATQRADAVRMLTYTADSIRNRNKQAAAQAAVMGATDESLAAARAANAEALAAATSNVAAMGQQRKDAVESQYMQTDQSLQSSLNDLEIQKAQNLAEAAKAAGEIGSQISGGVGLS